MLRTILLLQLLIAICWACKCATYSWRTTFEEAKWISQVKITGRKRMDDNRSLAYTVHHIDVFKKPEKLNDKIITLASSSACGVPDLKVGHEYLLAGTFANEKELRIVTCLTFAQKDNSGPMGAIQWDKVPSELQEKLKSGDFDEK